MRTSKIELHQFAFIPSIKIVLAIAIVLAAVCACPPMAGGSPIPTITTLTVAPNSVNAGAAVTLTATVLFEATNVTQGLVAFCDANAPHCEGSAMFGTAQLTSSGTATLKVILAVGSYSINAVFLGAGAEPSSTSIAQSLTVNGNSSYVSATTIAASGSAGNYTLTGTLAAFGRPLPTGTVSFQDTSNGNFVLGTEALDPGTLGFNLLPASALSSVGAAVSCATTGDFNLDGKKDLAVCNDNSTVSVLLGNGDGTFRSPVTYSTPDQNGTPYAIATGDFNGDGNTDLAVTNSVGGSAGTVSILLGNVDGTFQTQQTYAVGSGAQGITIGDFNHDGNADLAITNSHDNTVSVLLGNGDGTFQSQVIYAVGNQPSSVSAADFNGDGYADLVVSNQGDNNVSVLLVNRDGTFQPQVTYPTGNNPVAVTVGDFNGDGNADLAVANGNDGTVSVLLGNGDGIFQSQVTYATGGLPVGVTTGDFNGDGNADLAIANLVANNVSVLLGNGDGTFQSSTTYAAGSQPMGMAAADFNGDGLADVAAASHAGAGTITVLLSERTETATITGVSMYGPTHNVLASYAGDTSYAASQSNTTALVGIAWPTATSLRASANPGTARQPITFTSTVISTATVTPSGTVSFHAGTTLLGTGTVSNTGVATLTTSTLAAGSYRITAAYSGSSAFGSSTSTALSLTMQTAPTFTVNAPQPTVTVTQGGSVNVKINLLPVGGSYNSSVTLSASGLPPGVTATFNPPSVTPGGAGATSVMSIQTAAQTASIPQENNQKSPLAPVSLAAGICAIASKRKRFSQSLAILLAFATLTCGTMMLTGCAGLGAKVQSQSQPQSRDYVVTVVGTSGSHNASTNVTLVVQ